MSKIMKTPLEALDALTELAQSKFMPTADEEAVSNLVNSLTKFNQLRIIVVGLGGTGSWFMPKLVKTVNDLVRKDYYKGIEVILVDKDEVEHKNIVRQNFIPQDVGLNKAVVMANRYFPQMNIPDTSKAVYEYYVGRAPDEAHASSFMNMTEIIYTVMTNNVTTDSHDTLVFSFVDNSVTRKHIHDMANLAVSSSYEYVHGNVAQNITVIDVGNDMYNGQLVASSYIPFDFESAGSGNSRYYQAFPDDLEKTDGVDMTLSCAEADVDLDNQDQLMVANDVAATIAHQWLIAHLLATNNNMEMPVPYHIEFICGALVSSNTIGVEIPVNIMTRDIVAISKNEDVIDEIGKLHKDLLELSIYFNSSYDKRDELVDAIKRRSDSLIQVNFNSRGFILNRYYAWLYLNAIKNPYIREQFPEFSKYIELNWIDEAKRLKKNDVSIFDLHRYVSKSESALNVYTILIGYIKERIEVICGESES